MISLDQIRQAYDFEQTNMALPKTAADIPLSYELITPEWLTSVLSSSYPGIRVQSCRLGPADNGTFNRRRIYLQYADPPEGGNFPWSVFCKAAHSLASRLMIGNSGSIQAEITFYNKIRPLLDIEAPRSLFANYDPRSLACIMVLKDIGDEAIFCTHTTEITRLLSSAEN
jgi:hypothetical protein